MRTFECQECRKIPILFRSIIVKQKRLLKRRDFLAHASVAGAACVAGSSAVLNFPVSQLSNRATEPGSEFEVFQNLVGEQFQVVCEGTNKSSTLVLTDVSVRKSGADEKRPAHIRQDSCSLMFASRQGVELGNAIHRFNHPRLGSFELYIDQTRQDRQPNWKHYEAVIG
jgi:hypothetical protein